MRINIISLFPEMFTSLEQYGVVGKAIRSEIIHLHYFNPRDYTSDKHNTVDDRPYGGGPGMVMMAEPILCAIKDAQTGMKTNNAVKQKVVYLSPQGRRFDHEMASENAGLECLTLIAGRYEGIDERVLNGAIDEEWSIGDYVLSGGELPAMVVIDAIARWRPDALGNADSVEQDSFCSGLLDCPHYTRPEVVAGETVPEVLLSGNHAEIARWRKKQSLGRTYLRRPDLLEKIDLNAESEQLLEEFKLEREKQ